jgi:UDP-N-acetylglucosamine--N-acetylmuramyl-(pentapeptide) pyrophosphoryl-undecaprenol N-acetylglucosamine transferase
MPTALYEPNAVYGKANQVLALMVRKVFLGIVPESRAKELRTGVPIRRNFFDRCHDRTAVLKALNLDPQSKTVLVFGGSSGARTINRTVAAMVSRLATKGMQFIHVTGPADYEDARLAYINAKVPAAVFPYYEDMSMLYSVCDAVVARSGASSLAEIAYVGKPAVFVPYPFAYAHQSVNAAVVAGVKCVKIFEQDVLTPELLKTALEGFLASGVTHAEYPRIWTEPDMFAKMVCDEVMGGQQRR